MKLLSKKLIKVDPTPVYDLEVESDNHNFCLANGVVVHNSKDCADAVSGCLISIYQDMDNATKLSDKYKVQNVTSYYTNRLSGGQNRNNDIFTNILMGR